MQMKRVRRGGVGGINSDSDDEIEVDTSASLAHDRISIDYTEHLSKCQKQDHSRTKTQGIPEEVAAAIEPETEAEKPKKLRKQVRVRFPNNGVGILLLFAFYRAPL